MNIESMKHLASGCPCHSWARDGSDMYSMHHPRCEHYDPPPADPRFARFGEAMWALIWSLGEEFCHDEWSESVLPLAQDAGLCVRARYDPDVHGPLEAERGDEMWWGDWRTNRRGGALLK